MATTEQTPEQRELALVNKVELKIALSSSDTKLESTLNIYLAPLLLKLASEHTSVRNKVISICQHVNTRVQPDSIKLPVSALVKQFKEQHSALIRHFDILYIQQGINRLSAAEKADLLPIIIGGLASADKYAPQIFNLLLRLLENFTLPLRGSKEDLELRSKYSISDRDAACLAGYFAKLMLFAPQKKVGPGLSKSDVEFLNVQGKPDVWNQSAGGLNVLRTKVLAMKLLSSGLFNDRERFLPALFASADTASTLSDSGEDLLKRVLPSVDLEDDSILDSLFNVYFGSEVVLKASPPLQIKILGLLIKSTKSTTYSSRITKFAEDAITVPQTDGEDVVMGGTATSQAPSRQALKLRAAVFEYISFVARYGPSHVLHNIAPALISSLRDYVEGQGWPRPRANEDLNTRAYSYEVIGLLVKAGSKDLIFEPEHATLELLRWLFNALANDSGGTSTNVSIEEAMSTVLTAVSRWSLTRSDEAALESLLTEQMDLSEDLKANERFRSTRYAAVRFANRCLPYASIKARWIDVLAVAAQNERMEVKEEGERGLSPYWYLMLSGVNVLEKRHKLVYPGFDSLVLQFIPGSVLGTMNYLQLVRQARERRPLAFSSMVSYARHILYNEALQAADVIPHMGSEWERSLDAKVQNDVKARSAIQTYVANATASLNELQRFQAALFQQSLMQSTDTGSLVQYLSLAPDGLVEDLVLHSNELLPNISSNHHDVRLNASHAFGILASHPTIQSADETPLETLIARMRIWQTAVGAAVNQVHGAILALGFYFSRRHHRGLLRADDDRFTKYKDELMSDMINNATDSTIKESVFVALGQLSMFGLIKSDSEKLKASINKIFEVAKTGNEPAILALGQLAMACANDADLVYAEDKLHELHEVRQAEVHFSVGEAFSYLAAGWNSSALALKLDIPGSYPTNHDREGVLERLVDRFVKDCANTKPALKKAAVMWLLCLVQYCGHLQPLQSRLAQCQLAFKQCLVDRDELVQESASRGLGLVYEKGDRNLKDDLVRDLVSSFSSDKQSGLAGTVSADTQLFEPGALPTGDGSVSTYKDIMSLASEVGDSSLVYKFMSMASSNAIWSSRAAFGRFGLSDVLSDSSVDGYLSENPKLYPKLYRYRFDPNTGVRRSMNDIWNALVKDSAATINEHFDAIIKDLLVSVLGKEWRTRQASCAAIADLLQGRPLDRYETYLEDVWNKCFKVLDDIKESVRAAAASLARTLTGILTKALESDHSSTKTASAMLKHVLPFLLSPSGMESSAQEVQLFAVHTLLEIIKKSNGKTLRPFIPELVERLIGLLSSMEPEAVNYIHLNASKYNLTEQKIDDMRLSSVRSSPIMEAIERCLDLLDEDTMQTLQPRLEAAMKNAVGLPSKVGASRVLVSLATRRTHVFKPCADQFLKLIEKSVLDRNETVASSYAAAAGYVARQASDKQILRLVNFAKTLYFHAEGDRESSTPRRSISSGELIYALVKHANDRFNALAASVLPFVFLAKHDPHEAVQEQFKNTWGEAVGGDRAVALYLQEILELVKENIDSAQWTIKHTAARSIAAAVIAICGAERQLSRSTASALWPMLDKALSGKTWDGKEVLLDALVKFVEGGSSLYREQASVAAAITQVSLREAKRNNAVYRPHALSALAQVAAARSDVDISEQVRQIVEPLLVELRDEDPMDVDVDKNASTRNEVRDNTLAAAVESVLLSVNPKQGSAAGSFAKALSILQAIKQPAAVVVRKAVYVSLAKLFAEVGRQRAGDTPQWATDSDKVERLLFGPGSDDAEAVRMLRADAVFQIFQASRPMLEALRSSAVAQQDQERSIRVRDRLAAAVAAASVR